MKFYISYGERGRRRRNVYDCVHDFEDRCSAERWMRGQAIRLYELVMVEGKTYYFIADYDFYYRKNIEKYEQKGIEITDKMKICIEEKSYDDFFNNQVLAYVFATCWTDEDNGEEKE